jgi:hypothetical protein
VPDETPKFHPPPWEARDRGDGMIDIVPVDRPGTVMLQVPKRMGNRLILLANSFSDGGAACPKCLRHNAHRRSGPHFEHEMRCPNCGHVWEA